MSAKASFSTTRTPQRSAACRSPKATGGDSELPVGLWAWDWVKKIFGRSVASLLVRSSRSGPSGFRFTPTMFALASVSFANSG